MFQLSGFYCKALGCSGGHVSEIIRFCVPLVTLARTADSYEIGTRYEHVWQARLRAAAVPDYLCHPVCHRELLAFT